MRNEGGGFAAIDDEVAAVLAFVISHTTFLAAQNDEMGRCPKVPWIAGFPFEHSQNIDHLTANDKDLSLTLEMTIRESDVSQSLRLLVLSLAANHQSLISSNNTSRANL